MTTAKQPNVPAWLAAILIALGVIGDAPWRRPPTTTAGAVLVASHLRDHPDTRELTTNG